MDTLLCMKMLNALFAFLALIVVQGILRQLKINEKTIVLIDCLVGFSFSILRYATENETYIIPLFFALLASYFYVNYTATARNNFALNSALWATIAVLFHQIYFFWWIGLLIGFLISKNRRPVQNFLLISLLGPLTYLIVIRAISKEFSFNVILNFLRGDLGINANLGLSFRGLFFSFMNLLRSFIQIHGYMINMILSKMLFLVPGIISILFFILALLNLPTLKKNIAASQFSNTHVSILLLQFIFALLSAGNAEFMVMIPVLFLLLVPVFTLNAEKFLFRIMIAIVIWNISYGVVPLYLSNQEPEKFLCDAVIKEKNLIVIASDDQLLLSILYYETGNLQYENIYKSPALLITKGKDKGTLSKVIEKALNERKVIYTDCIGPKPVSRASIIEGKVNEEFFSKYISVEIKTWKSITGQRSVYKLELKQQYSSL